MKSGGALTRRTPLKARAALVAKTELKRTTALATKSPLARRLPPVGRAVPLARTPMKKTATYTGPDAAMCALVDARDRKRCVRCGGPAQDRQHRMARGVGGTADPAINAAHNLILVCRSCHDFMEDRANLAVTEAAGWVVLRRSGRDPASVPCAVHGIGLVLLTADGRYSPLERAA